MEAWAFMRGWFVGLVVCGVVCLMVGVAIGEFLGEAEIAALKKSNSGLHERNIELQSMLDVPAGCPPIVTRLGVKLMDNGLRYRYYLWVTGEVVNNGSLPAFNVTVLFSLRTPRGSVLRAVNMGTFGPFQVFPFRHEIDAEGEYIESWAITTKASYLP